MTIEDVLETSSSIIAFGTRAAGVGETDPPVVLKIVRSAGDEWDSGEVVDAFEGEGMVRALEHEPGAILLERLAPGRPLATLSLAGRDDDATRILADVMARMHEAPRRLPAHVPTALQLGHAFERYLASTDERIPRALVSAAHEEFAALCASQGPPRLLHGDLQHYNVLYDDVRGWAAIDPKGVVAELEYEIGASLRNPVEMPALFTSRDAIERRIAIHEGTLRIDGVRALRWARAQAVLSLVWSVEDGVRFGADHPQLDLARMIDVVLADGGYRSSSSGA